MTGWHTTTLDDVCLKITDGAHNSPKSVSHGKPMASVKDLTFFGIDLKEARHISIDDYDALVKQGCRPEVGDVLVAKDGNSALDTVCVVRKPIDAVLLSSVAILRPDKQKILPDLLKYYFRSAQVIQYLKSNFISGAAIPRVVLKDFKRAKITLPELPEQERIVEVLNSLDDKIELNQRMNETLEAIARALFKSWFVNFDPVRAKAEGRKPEGMDVATATLFPATFNDDGLPEGWERGTFGSIAESAGTTVQPSQTSPDTPYIGLEHMPRRCIALSEWEGAGKVTSNKFAFLRGDFLFGKLRPYFHKVGIAAIDGISSTDILIVRPKREEFYAFVLSVISSTEFVGYTDKSSQGTKMPRTNWKDMARYELVLPDKAVALAYNKAIKPMLEQIIANVHENRTLAALRDALLPKLISGELRIDDAKGKRGK